MNQQGDQMESLKNTPSKTSKRKMKDEDEKQVRGPGWCGSVVECQSACETGGHWFDSQ